MLTSVPVSFIFRIEAEVAPPISISGAPQGDRMIVPAQAGQFSGPDINGKIVPGAGVEWASVRADGVIKADVRLVLETDDGASILMTYNGLAKPVDDSLHVTIAPLFETGAANYLWLNDIQAIGFGRPTEKGIGYDIYQLMA